MSLTMLYFFIYAGGMTSMVGLPSDRALVECVGKVFFDLMLLRFFYYGLGL